VHNKFPLKKASLYAILFVFVLGSCREDEKKEIQVDAIGTMENEHLALRESLKKFAGDYAAAWSGKDPEAVAAFFAQDGSLKVNGDEPAQGREAITGVARGFMDAFPDMVVTMDSLVKTPDGLDFYWTLTGTHTGNEGSGKPVKISGLERWHLNADGLVQSSIGSFDQEEYQRQLMDTSAVGP
jgi:hypothetical protein